MAKKKPSPDDLLAQINDLRQRLEEAEETLRAIRSGEVDALLVSTPQGDQIFTLKGADHTFRVLVETINEGAATLMATNGTVIYANRVLAELLQMPLERLIGSCFCDYVPQAERRWFDALLAKARQGTSKGEIRLQASEGKMVPAYLSLSTMQLENVPEAVCLAVTDLSEQKQNEAFLAEGRLSQQILAQSEQPIAVIDAEGQIIRASRGLHRLCGFNPLMQSFEQAFPLCFGNSEPFSPDILKECKIIHNEEMHFFRRDGSQVFLLVNAGPLLDEKQQVKGCVIAFTDITERKQQEMERVKFLEHQQALTEELMSTNEELQSQAEELSAQKDKLEKLNESLNYQKQLLEAANEEMESFSYSVSHDLKIPVRAIQGFSRMLLGEHADRLDAEGRRLLGVIIDNTRLMQHLIDDLLALSRLGRMKIQKGVVNLTLMARQIFGELRGQAPKRDIRLVLGDLPPALGDQSLLYQVMTNLLSNAVKFTEPRETASIEVGGRIEGKENIYYVKDNGVGFDDRYVSNLFRPFQRLHAGTEFSGTGVGLAIVQRIIKRHGGRVWAKGKVNEGATFYFALPNNA